jgi:hypothetical protein
MTATRSSAYLFGSPFRNPGEQHGSGIVRRLGLTLRLDQQAGFSNSRLAREQHSPAPTAPSGIDRASQHCKLGASTKQRQVRAL